MDKFDLKKLDKLENEKKEIETDQEAEEKVNSDNDKEVVYNTKIIKYTIILIFFAALMIFLYFISPQKKEEYQKEDLNAKIEQIENLIEKKDFERANVELELIEWVRVYKSDNVSSADYKKDEINKNYYKGVKQSLLKKIENKKNN